MYSKSKSLKNNVFVTQSMSGRTTKPRVSDQIRAQVDKINRGLPSNPRTQVSRTRRQVISVSDSDEDRLLMDCDDDSKHEISGSDDSFDSGDDEKTIDGRKSAKKLKRERVMKWWAKNFDEKVGDSSKIIEITLSDEEDDEEMFEVITPKVKLKSEKSDNKSDLKEVFKKATQIQDKEIREALDSLKFIEERRQKSEQKHFVSEVKSEKEFNCSEKWSDSQTVITKIGKPIDKYICFLCSEILESCEEAKNHYLSHLDVFLVCGECNQKFASIHSFRSHNSQHLGANNMKNLDEFMIGKKWTDHYIQYIERHEELMKEFCPTNRMFCPICYKIRQIYKNSETNCKKFEKSMKLSKIDFNEEFVSNHLHQHFQYFPYLCIDCHFNDKNAEFCLNRTARQHLLEVHNIKNAFDLKTNELKVYFDLKKSIKELDKQIDKCLSISVKMIEFWQKSRQKCDKNKIFVSKKS